MTSVRVSELCPEQEWATPKEAVIIVTRGYTRLLKTVNATTPQPDPDVLREAAIRAALPKFEGSLIAATAYVNGRFLVAHKPDRQAVAAQAATLSAITKGLALARQDPGAAVVELLQLAIKMGVKTQTLGVKDD